MGEYKDELISWVEWTPNRNVLVFRRDYADRSFVRARVFYRHLNEGFWYPGPRSFHVNQDCAEELGEVISCAGRDEQYCHPPGWWDEFEAQYEAKGRAHTAKWKRESAAR